MGEVLSLKKLKKDGSLDSAVIENAVRILTSGQRLLLPLDSIYGIATIMNDQYLREPGPCPDPPGLVRLISSFHMLDTVAVIDKMEFDFLHRVWPGEIIVHLKDIKNTARHIPVRMPRTRYLLDLIDHVGKPLLYRMAADKNGSLIYRKKDLLALPDELVDARLVIDECCRPHAGPTILDVSGGALTIIREGKVSAEEIKSLYFLGADDAEL